jgi:malate/lactate dehydrogenase
MKITVVGAGGSVGSAAAFNVAAQRLADEMVLIDYKDNLAKQHALDLSTAVSARGVKVIAGCYADLEGSDIVINAAGVPQGMIKDRMELLPKNTDLMRSIAQEIKQYCPKAIIITATNPADAMNYAIFRAGGFDRNQVLGYSINDSYRFREFIAKAYDVEVNRVDGYCIGEHGSSQVLVFSSAAIDGKPVAVSEEIKTDIYSEVPLILKRFEELQAGRTAGWTCAIGFEEMIRAIIEDSGKVIPCSSVVDGEYGYKGLSMSVPSVLGRGGIREIKELGLAPDEQEKLTASAGILQNAASMVDQILG